MNRWILGNLDCETSWAQEAGRREGRSVRPLPQHVLGRIALYATLLRVFAEEGDTVWTPAPIDARCVRPVNGLPEVTWADGEVSAGALESEPLVWARADPLPLSVEELDVMLTVADKTVWWAHARSLSSQLPGSRCIRGVDELDEPRPESWIAKARYSAAGRGRVRGSGDKLRVEARRGVERLIEDQGRVLLEPWLQRTRDFGCWRAGTDPDDAGGWHDLAVDGSGRFQGITTPLQPSPPEDDLGSHLFDLQYAASQAGKLLEPLGYDGPFGFDAFQYTDSAGNDRIHAPCEINPRLTFGRVAHEYRTRLAIEDRVRLVFGHAPQPDDERVIPLLGSATEAVMYAWLERLPT